MVEQRGGQKCPGSHQESVWGECCIVSPPVLSHLPLVPPWIPALAPGEGEKAEIAHFIISGS